MGKMNCINDEDEVMDYCISITGIYAHLTVEVCIGIIDREAIKYDIKQLGNASIIILAGTSSSVYIWTTTLS